MQQHVRNGRSRSFRRSTLSAAILSAIAGLAQALPQGGAVAAGSGSISESGSNMTVTQSSQKLIVDWQSFGIASGESVQFVQPGADAVALNRVLGNNRSEIYGNLSANGQVFLTNPNGILFGPTAQVDVGGLVASTLAISNADFLNGNYVFSGEDGGTITNQGTLQAADGGVIALLAPEVRNEGLVLAREGAIGLAAGTRVRLDLADGFSLEVEESALDAVIENRQALRAEGGVILLSATARQSLLSGMINNTGVIEAGSATDAGGSIRLVAGFQSLGGTIAADGTSGGTVALQAHHISQYGAVSADGRSGQGGRIVLLADAIVQPVSAAVHASGTTAGGSVYLQGRDSVFTSGTLTADGGEQGGRIDLRGDALTLAAATLTATGASAGGSIKVGGDYQGRGLRQQAGTTWINAATTLDASATQSGNGGEVIVWSDASTAFAGTALARGGALGGDGGLIEVSGADTLQFAGIGDASAANGIDGTLLLDPKNILITDTPMPALQVIPLLDPTPTPGDLHGAGQSLELVNGNIVQASIYDDFAATDAGAVYMYRQSDGALLSMLTGSSADDHVGGVGIKAVANGNFIVGSDDWDNGAAADAGAVTWGSATAGVSGVVGAGNSLVGSHAGDRIGTDSLGGNGLVVLSNGNYVVRSPDWDNGSIVDAGAATFGNGATGIAGEISAANSLVGSSTFDRVAGRAVDYAEDPVIEVGDSNYVVSSGNWNNGAVVNAGAVTWGSGTTGVAGVISAANSLVGSQDYDEVGQPNLFLGTSGVLALSNGNYLVSSSAWNNGAVEDAGAVTFGNGNTGITGTVTATNSLVGSSTDDSIGWTGGILGGNGYVLELANGNFVLGNPDWDSGAISNAGAVTWGSGTTGVTGVVSAANSLIGSSSGDRIGSSGGVAALGNGNYVVVSTEWNNGAASEAGAVTFGNGATGTSGVVSAANSLVGTQANDHVGERGIFELSNGNYVVVSPDWDNGAIANAGAVTWGSGAAGVNGAVSVGNSLVGSHVDDHVGVDGVTALANGNYVFRSSSWSDGITSDVSAVTWAQGGASSSGTVSAGNSLVGSHAGDNLGGLGIIAFNNGNYVVNSPDWNNGSAVDAGAVTWGNGASGSSGTLDAGNSLVGTSAGDRVGAGGIHVLANQNFVVGSPFWSNGGAANAGAVTLGSDVDGIAGEVNGGNSLIGSSADDRVGEHITVLSNSNYVVASPDWDNGAAVDAGAVTWGNGSAPVVGAVSDSNSIYGASTNDRVGLGGITELADGNYVINSYEWKNAGIPGATQAGAVTWANGYGSSNFDVDGGNSLVGSQAGDHVGSGGVTALSNGNYVVSSPEWDNGTTADAGAVTWGNGSGGVVGEIGSANSLVGNTAQDAVGNGGVIALNNGNYVVRSIDWHNGPGAGAGAITLADGSTGVAGEVSAFNSLVGTQPGDQVGNAGITELLSGDVLVTNPFFHNDSGRVDILRLVSGPTPLSGNLLFGDGPNLNVTLSPGRLTDILGTGTRLVLQANNDITVQAPILVDNPVGSGGDLTLQAGRSVNLNADIVTDGGNLTVVANERQDRGVIASERDAGPARISIGDNVTLDAGSGTLRLLLAGGAYGSDGSVEIGSGAKVNARQAAVLSYLQGGDINLAEGSVLTGNGDGLALLVGAANGGQLNLTDGAAHAQTPNGVWLAFRREQALVEFALGDSNGVITTGEGSIAP